jgi:hypothetical protein
MGVSTLKTAILRGLTGDSVEAIVLYIDTGTAGSSRLIMFQDTGVTGLPLTPEGSDVQINVNAAGWFSLRQYTMNQLKSCASNFFRASLPARRAAVMESKLFRDRLIGLALPAR